MSSISRLSQGPRTASDLLPEILEVDSAGAEPGHQGVANVYVQQRHASLGSVLSSDG
jgi:hypothetical protein